MVNKPVKILNKSVTFDDHISMQIVATDYDLPEFYHNCKILKSTLKTEIPLVVEVSKTLYNNHPSEAKIIFTNTFNQPLHEVQLTVLGTNFGINDVTFLEEKRLKKGESRQRTYTLLPKKTGKGRLLATVNSVEIQDIQV